MNFFEDGITILQAERKLEDFILNDPSEEFYLKDIPLTEEDYTYVMNIVMEYSKNVYSFDDYKEILLLFIVYGYIVFKTQGIENIFKNLFIFNTSHIPQHHTRHLVYLIANLFLELGISMFDNNIESLETVLKVLQKHAFYT